MAVLQRHVHFKNKIIIRHFAKTPHTKVIGGSVNSQRPEVVSSTTNPLAVECVR